MGPAPAGAAKLPKDIPFGFLFQPITHKSCHPFKEVLVDRTNRFPKTCFQALTIICLVFFLPLLSVNAEERSESLPKGYFVVFGPEDYSRTTSKPEITIDTFSFLNPQTSYILKIYNGGNKGQFMEKVSSVNITLNDLDIVQPNGLNQNIDIVEIPIELDVNNELSIEIRSKPGSGFTLLIIGWDDDSPEIVTTVSPPPNTAGWNNTDVMVSFECSDQTSGIQFCPEPVVVDTEGADQVISATAIDNAGNTASASVNLNIDKTTPTITAIVDRPPDTSDWYTSDVTVSFECADTLSNISTCPEPILVRIGQEITGTAVDNAGNTASSSVILNIDKKPPTIIPHINPPPNAAGWNNTDVTVSFECTDEGSGVASCPDSVEIADEGAVQNIDGTAMDLTGHSNEITVVVNIDKTPPDLAITTQAETPALEIAYINNYAKIYTSGPLNVFKPAPDEMFFALGDYIENREGVSYAHGVSAVVKELRPGALAKPVSFYDFANYRGFHFWVPVPPEGYRCLGMLVRNNYPSVDEVRCVKEELTAPAMIVEEGAVTYFVSDCSFQWCISIPVWEVLPADENGLYLGTFTPISAQQDGQYYVIREDAVKKDSWVTQEASSVNGFASDTLSGVDMISCNGTPISFSDSEFSCEVTLQAGQNNVEVLATDLAGNTNSSTEIITYAQEALDVAYTTEFALIWNDVGSGGSYNGAYYRPIPPTGYYALGHYGQIGYGPPEGIALVVKELIPGALAKPAGLKMVWHDAGSGADRDGGFWKAIPPPGYRCPGLVVTPNYDYPGLDYSICIRKELLAPGYIGSQIWIDERTGALRDFGSWQISPKDENGMHTGVFAGISYLSDGGYAKPAYPVYVLDKRSVAGSVEMSEAEINAIIDTYAPVLEFYPDEQYFPDDPEYILDNASLCRGLVRNEGSFNDQFIENQYCVGINKLNIMNQTSSFELYKTRRVPQNDRDDFRIWLQIPESLIHGNLERAKPLIHIKPRGVTTEIQFWYFYPFNGPGRVRICIAHCEEEWLNQNGRHYGDWEMVSLLVDNHTHNVIAVGLSQHGNVEWVQYDRLEKYDKYNGGLKPIIYPGYNSHANYAQTGRHYYLAKDKGPITVRIFDITGGGERFITGAYIMTNEDSNTTPDWLLFPYRWGQYIKNHDDIYFMSTNYYDQEEVGMGPTGPAMKLEW